MSGLHVIGGLDVEAKQSRKEARRRAAPFLNRWRQAARDYLKAGNTPRIQLQDLELQDWLTRFPSANDLYSYPSQQRAADQLRVSLRTAQRMFGRLLAAGFLAPEYRGQGRSARWYFAIAGRRLSQCSLAGLDVTDLSGLDVTELSGLDPTDLAYKPIERQPIERSLSELQPEAPSPPPPSMTPREARSFGRELATELLSGLTHRQRQHARWRGLSIWIADQIERGAERVDVACGIAMALPSLKGEPPSTYDYFRQPIERARASRLKPLPELSGQLGHSTGNVSQSRLVAYIAERLGVGTAAITALGADWLAEQHQQFVARTIGMPEIVAAARQRLTEGGAS